MSAQEVLRQWLVTHGYCSGQLYETTTFRTEGAYTDGRHPDEVETDAAMQRNSVK